MDVYRVSITVDRLIPVEDISEFCCKFAGRIIWQEELTQQIANEFKAEVRSVGTHGSVETVCEVTA